MVFSLWALATSAGSARPSDPGNVSVGEDAQMYPVGGGRRQIGADRGRKVAKMVEPHSLPMGPDGQM